MDLQGMLGGLIGQYMNGHNPTSREETGNHYDQVANAVPQDMLASVIGPALGSLGTGQVRERIYNSATEMDAGQRGDFMSRILSGLGGSGINLGSLLGGLGVNPGVAQNPSSASPDDVAKVATYAKENQPGIFDDAMRFYAAHPTLVKVLGGLAVGAIMRQLGNRSGAQGASMGGGGGLLGNILGGVLGGGGTSGGGLDGNPNTPF